MNEFKLNILDKKVLCIVYHLNKIDKFPNANGVYKIIKGIVDDETINYNNIPGYSTCISITQKRLTFKISMLIRHGYLVNIYHKEQDDFFLKITPKASQEIINYFSEHPDGFKQNFKVVKPSIVTIKNVEK